jgi:hypothetical protein
MLRRPWWLPVVLATVAALVAGCSMVQPLVLQRRPASEKDPWIFGEEIAPPVDDPDEIVFAAVGDMGSPGVVQATIAKGVEKACEGRCDFVLLLGDNLYWEGVEDRGDEETLSCLVGQYPSKRKYLVLGNHDYIPTRPDLTRARNQLNWIRKSAEDTRDGVGAAGRFHFYRFQAGFVKLVALDTNILVRGRVNSTYAELARWLGPLRSSADEWIIMFGHHAYVSNGEHGDAGTYLEGGFKLWPATFLQHFFTQHVIGRAHLYIAGHDHNLQFFSRSRGYNTAQIVSGSGSKCNPRGDRAADRAEMERYGYGFALVEARRGRLTVSFHDYNGKRFWGAYRTPLDPEWHPLNGFPKTSVDTTDRCPRDYSRMLRESRGAALRVCRGGS